MKRIAPRRLGILGLLLLCALARGQDNLVRNGDFSQGADTKGWPVGWEFAGDDTVQQSLSLDHDPQRGPCARHACTRITGGGPATHAMLDQRGAIGLKAGQWYRLSFWARQEGIAGGALSLAISDIRTWRDSGIHEGLRVGRSWKHFDFAVRSQIDLPAASSRFQIWHHSTGTLWLSDVTFVPAEPPRQTRAPLLETAGRKNLLPNSSFECGLCGWGGITEQRLGWGNLDALSGTIDTAQAKSGQRCLRINLDEKNTPVFSFDYFEARREPLKMMLAGNRGWIPVAPGSQYTLSAWLKADRTGLPAVLSIYFGDSPQSKPLVLTQEWQRYSLTVKAPADACFVALGPDLRRVEPAQATVWIDDVQLEKGNAPTAYESSDPVEVGVEPASRRFISSDGHPVELLATASNHTQNAAQARVAVRFTDFFDAPAGGRRIVMEVPAHGIATAKIDAGLVRPGFYRAVVETEAAGQRRTTKLRLAVIKPYQATDSVFGINHAYPWDATMKLAQEAGIVWVRDWSLKWQSIEPAKGRFTFSAIDPVIDRPARLGEKLDLLLPFPSANWSSSAPEGVSAGTAYPSIRQRMAYMPRDMSEFSAYVTACVDRYKDRAGTWEVLNEPIYTDYALPSGRGYTPRSYVSLLKVAYAAVKKADPQATVIGGLAGNGNHLALYDQLIQAGGLDFLDILDIHSYPGLAPPEEHEIWLDKLNAMMRLAGKPRPMWMTEYGYYAEDEPSLSPLKWEMPVVESEKRCAAYYVRLNTILLSHNVTRLFYHAGAASRLNAENLEGIFFEYGGAPRKMYTAQAAMAKLFAPPTRFVERLSTPAGLRAYLFENATGALIVAWATEEGQGRISLGDNRLRALDIQGNAMESKAVDLSEYPIYIQGKGLGIEQLKQAIQITGQ